MQKCVLGYIKKRKKMYAIDSMYEIIETKFYPTYDTSISNESTCLSFWKYSHENTTWKHLISWPVFFFVFISPESTVQEALGYHYFGYGFKHGKVILKTSNKKQGNLLNEQI